MTIDGSMEPLGGAGDLRGNESEATLRMAYRGTGGEVWASLEARAAVGDNRGASRLSIRSVRTQPSGDQAHVCPRLC